MKSNMGLFSLATTAISTTRSFTLKALASSSSSSSSSTALHAHHRLSTCFTEPVHPLVSRIVLAPMGGCAGGELAAAVAEAGGIGLVGSGGDTVETLREQYAIALRKISDATVRRKLGFGINVNQIEDEFPAGTLAALVKDLSPGHVYLSFGDVAAHVATIRAAPGGGVGECAVYSNAGDVAQALEHAAAGCDCVVMQGSDAGGHTHHRASVFALVPEARSALDRGGYGDVLVVAAGGVGDGRGLAAAITLGADAAVLGTRLASATESILAVAEGSARGRPTGLRRRLQPVPRRLNGIDDHSSGLPGRCLVTRSTALQDEGRSRRRLLVGALGGRMTDARRSCGSTGRAWRAAVATGPSGARRGPAPPWG